MRPVRAWRTRNMKRNRAELRVLFVVLGLWATCARARTPVPGGCETPASERTSEIGCYFAATADLGELPQTDLFWHLYTYPDDSSAQSAREPRSTVASAFGKVWMFTVAGSDWRP